MRGLRRQVQHGPTCRSIVILVVGLCVISIGMRPRFQQRNLDISRQAEDDDLRQMLDHSDRSRATIAHSTVRGSPLQAASASRGASSSSTASSSTLTSTSTSTALDPNAIHVILTSNGSPYMNWQSRIMYHSYLQVASLPGSDMKFFTRVLHRSTPDALMDVMPTYRVDPLDPTCDNWCEYPVASRPDAINKWLNSGDPKAEWVFMIETDYVFVKPVAVPKSGQSLGFPFGYIVPSDPTLYPCIQKLLGGQPVAMEIQGTGNAPTIMRIEELRKVVPKWMVVTAAIEADANCKERFGWVREMYAFSMACYATEVKLDLPAMPHAIMSQPPADNVEGDAAILHYTWGSRFKDGTGKVTWEFEKRAYTDKGLPDRFPDLPPEATDVQRLLMRKVNEAIDDLPKYTRGELREMGKSEADIQAYMDEFERAKQQRAEQGAAGAGASGRLEQQKAGEVGRGIHAMATSNGNPYMNWQTLLMYHTYQKMAAEPGSDLKYFTRVLHRTQDDELMGQIPTVRVKPLHPECDGWCEYPVADRPDAIQQWIESGDVKGDWIFMIETDYLFVKPVQIPVNGRAIGFPFGYIIPTWPTIKHIMVRYYPGDLKEIPQTGNAPVLAKTEDLRRVVPIWSDITARFEQDEAAKKELGWVREMYAFSIAAALGKMPIDLPPVPKAIMVQPPADSVLGDASIIHYTWGSFFKDAADKEIWRFEKRDFTQPGDHPHVLCDPPPGAASELQQLMIDVLNDAIRAVYKEACPPSDCPCPKQLGDTSAA